MSIEKYYPAFENCLQKEEPGCQNICPFHLDVFDFQEKMSRNKYDRAYKVFKNAVAFPDIVAALCPEYCHSMCPRKDYDGAVQLNLLEQTCVVKAKRKDPTMYNAPKKDGKIGIIGGGMSGLACALKLLEKSYEVVIFEKENEIGGQLKDLLPKDLYTEDLQRQFGKLQYDLKTDTEIKNLDELKDYGFNCIYVATGKRGNDFNTLNQETGNCYMWDEVAVYGGGSLAGKDVVQSIADGLEIAWACDMFLKTGRLEYPGPYPPTEVVPDVEKFVPSKPVEPTENGIFTDKEAEIAALRCIRCQCDACMTYCDMVQYADQWPVPMREEVSRTVASSESMVHQTPSIRVINLCTQCGVYEEMCPADIQLGAMMLEARKLLHKQEKMPPAFHGFWLDDMEYSNSESAKISKKAPGKDSCTYAFFPGCNLGAADPKYVEESYNWLLHNFDDMGLLLRCCGVPSEWSGNEKMHEAQIESLKADWEELGKPTLVMACPSCTRHIHRYLPEINTISIYELMSTFDKWPQGSGTGKDMEFSIFDPCSARNDEGMKQALRDTAAKVGFNAIDLPKRDKHGCCGFGGNVEVASPGYLDFIAKKRSILSDNPYLTYCINCRDIFLDEGKPALHMFDVLFDINGLDAKTPGLTKRRNNRYDLKKDLLKKCWGEEMTETGNTYPFSVEIGDEIYAKMDELKIVEDDIKEVIERSNKLNRRTFNPETGEYTCYAKLNYITCWVTYIKEDDVYHIKNVYTHRMDIDLEGIWNGRKIETDM